MRTITLSVILAAALILGQGCKKDGDTIVDPPAAGAITFSTGSIMQTAAYFSFDTKDTVKATQAWDIKLTTLFAPNDLTRSYPFPGIALNRTRNVTGKIVDGTAFETLDPSTVTGLAPDASDSTYVIGTLALSYNPTTHIVSPYDKRVFVVKTPTGKLVKFRMVSCYSTTGALGYMTFEYQY